MSFSRVMYANGEVVKFKNNPTGFYKSVGEAKKAAKLFIHQRNKRSLVPKVRTEDIMVVEYDLREINKHPIN